MTPDEIAESSRHPQQRIREADNRPDPNASTSGARGVTPEPVGDSAGPDTSGAVAKPAAERKPGASSKLGGTPGANATRSSGRQTD